MSRHLLAHLIVPLIVGMSIEMFIAWYRHPDQFALSDYLASKERIGFYVGIFVTYLAIALWLVHREAKPPWDYTLTEELDRVLTNATSFFATCTIPMRAWFDPYTQQYFSHLIKPLLGNSGFPQERVLLFTRRGERSNVRERYLDGHFAKPLAEIHKNYGIKLGFMDYPEVQQINAEVNCPKLDFALVTYPGNRSVVYTFDKRRDPIKLEVLKTEKQIAPYETLVEKIRAVVFDDSGELDPKHNFRAFVM